MTRFSLLDMASISFGPAEPPEPVVGYRYYRFLPQQAPAGAPFGLMGKIYLSRSESADEATEDAIPTCATPPADPSYGPEKLIDPALPAYGWIPVAGALDTSIHHATWDYGTPREIKRMRTVTMASASFAPYAFVGWDLLGSNNLSDWTTVMSERDLAPYTEAASGNEKLFIVGQGEVTPEPVDPVSSNWRLVITNTSQGLGRAYGSEWLPLNEAGVVISSGITYSAPAGMATGSEAAFHDSNTLGINAYNGPLPITVNMTLASPATLHGLRWWSDNGGAFSACPRAMRLEWNDGGTWKTHLEWSGYTFPWTGNSQAATFNASNAN